MNREEKRFLEIVRSQAFLRGEFTLTSGKTTSYYFDMKRVMLSPDGALLVGKLVLRRIPRGINAVGGPDAGGGMITNAVVIMGGIVAGRPIPGFVVSTKTKEPKLHIRGNFPRDGKVAIVEDVITTGGSILKAIEVVEAEGCEIAKVIVLLDRQQGGLEALRKRGYDVEAILKADVSTGEVYINE